MVAYAFIINEASTELILPSKLNNYKMVYSRMWRMIDFINAKMYNI